MSKRFYDDQSRLKWCRTDGSKPDAEGLKVGCLQRIADATEAMAQRYQELLDDRDRYKRLYVIERDECEQIARSNAALRGAITKMKRQLAETPTP